MPFLGPVGTDEHTVTDSAKAFIVESLSQLDSNKRRSLKTELRQDCSYHNLVTVLILLRQWGGKVPLGSLVPGGPDICTIEFANRTVWFQATPARINRFQSSDVAEILDLVEERAAALSDSSATRCVAILDQPYVGDSGDQFRGLVDDEAGNTLSCHRPHDKILNLLATHLQISPFVAEEFARDLCKSIEDVASNNASLPFDQRRRVSTADVDQCIIDHSETDDPNAIQHALLSGSLAPVDFSTPLDEPYFYSGVNVRPGHIAAGLVVDRPKDVEHTLEQLKQKRHVLLSGHTRTGKSALLWLTAATTSSHMRMYEIAYTASVVDAHAIARFVRANPPTETVPVCLILDHLDPINSDIWNILVGELKAIPHLYFLATLWDGDSSEIAYPSDTAFLPVETIEEDLACAIWDKLATKRSTRWDHWTEPLKIADEKLQQYTHLLVHGRTYEETVADQIRHKERENRDVELAIIRGASVLLEKGCEVDINCLFEQLELNPDEAHQALETLKGEHLLRESRPGVLGNFYEEHSGHLSGATHGWTFPRPIHSLWKSLPAVTTDSLPRVIHSLLSSSIVVDTNEVLQKLADLLVKTDEVDRWTAILTALGEATIGVHVTRFTVLLEEHNVDRSHWSLAAAFLDLFADVDEFSESSQWEGVQDAESSFRKSTWPDYRQVCLARLPSGTNPPRAKNIAQAIRLLSACVPICDGPAVQLQLHQGFLDESDPDVRQLARLLSLANLIDPDLFQAMVKKLGGEQAMFDLFNRQIAWTTPPEIETSDQYDPILRSNWHYLDAKQQTDPKGSVREACEVLLAISPRYDDAECVAVDSLGNELINQNDEIMYSHRSHRFLSTERNCIPWALLFRQTVHIRSEIDDLADYANRMADLIRATEKVFRSFSENWIKQRRDPFPDALVTEAVQIEDRINDLTYFTPVARHVTDNGGVGYQSKATLRNLMLAVLDDIVLPLDQDESLKEIALEAAEVCGLILRHDETAIWRTHPTPPNDQLSSLTDRLRDVSSICHEMESENRLEPMVPIFSTAKRARSGRALGTAARRCRMRADDRFTTQLRRLESALASKNWRARVLSRPIDELTSHYWPAKEVAISVEIDDLVEQWPLLTPEVQELVRKHLGNDRVFRLSPVVNGLLVPVRHTRSGLVHYPESAREWAEIIDLPILYSALMDRFEEAVSTYANIIQLGLALRDQELRTEEEGTVSRAIDIVLRTLDELTQIARQPETEHFAPAVDYLRFSVKHSVKELKAGIPVKAGKDKPDIESLRLKLLQTECYRLSDS